MPPEQKQENPIKPHHKALVKYTLASGRPGDILSSQSKTELEKAFVAAEACEGYIRIETGDTANEIIKPVMYLNTKYLESFMVAEIKYDSGLIPPRRIEVVQ